MFTYRCPGCGKQHVAEKEPDQGFTAKCLRCQGIIEVPARPAVAAPATAGASAASPPTESKPANAKRATARSRLKEAITRQSAKPARSEEQKSLPSPPPKPASPAKKEPEKRGLLVGGILAVILVGGGVGAYFLFAHKADTKPPPPSRTAQKSPPKTNKPSGTVKGPDPKATEKKPPGNGPVFKPTTDKVTALSAARLSAECAADLAEANHKLRGVLGSLGGGPSAAQSADLSEANRKYRGALLQVTGRFAKIEQLQSVRPPARPHAALAVEGCPVRCDLLGSPTPELRWRALTPGELITVRGAFSSDGFLHGCELLPPEAIADSQYKGKEIELIGHVETISFQGFPTLRLEPETRNSTGVVCLFRKSEEEEVRKLQPGEEVTVRGTCSGLEGSGGRFNVRMDNCRLVYTTTPEPPARRCDASVLLRDYDEVLSSSLLPPAGSEEHLAPLTVADLVSERSIGAQAMQKKYRYKILTLTGRLWEKVPVERTVILESGDTDTLFKVRCVFSRHAFQEVEDQKVFRVRGLCTGVPDEQTLRLDNCELFDPKAAKDAQRLTVDFLPHVPGQNRTYDFAVFSPLSDSATVVRQTYLQREGGLTETVTTHVGTLRGMSLFDKAEQGRWVLQRGTRKARALPGTTYSRRLGGGFLEIGERIVTKTGATEMVWESALKLGARPGASWSWSHSNIDHQVTLVQFERHRGRPAAIIKETARLPGSATPVEIRHVYVLGVGEVERREWLRISASETRVLREKRLVEDSDGPPPARSNKGGIQK